MRLFNTLYNFIHEYFYFYELIRPHLPTIFSFINPLIELASKSTNLIFEQTNPSLQSTRHDIQTFILTEPNKIKKKKNSKAVKTTSKAKTKIHWEKGLAYNSPWNLINVDVLNILREPET